MANDLIKLPPPHEAFTGRTGHPVYTADQVRDIVRAALTAPVATEQAQAVAEALALNPSLHPNSTALVVRFARALSDKLAAAQEKYGYSDGWLQADWMDECRKKLIDHVAKGDPRDVAAYCAFLWHHGEKTFVPTKAAPYESLMNEVMACGGDVTPREIIFNHATFDMFMQSRKGKTALDFFADDVESSLAASPEAAPAAMAIDRESLIDLIEDNLHAVYHCTRVWSAWGIGTMSEDDFREARGTELAPDLADAIIAKFPAATPAAPSAATDEQVRASAYEHCFKASEIATQGEQLYLFDLARIKRLCAALAQPAPVQPTTINGEPATAHSLLAALIDIHDDAWLPPEDRSYVGKAWPDIITAARAFLTAPVQQDAPAPSMVGDAKGGA